MQRKVGVGESEPVFGVCLSRNSHKQDPIGEAALVKKTQKSWYLETESRYNKGPKDICALQATAGIRLAPYFIFNNIFMGRADGRSFFFERSVSFQAEMRKRQQLK